MSKPGIGGLVNLQKLLILLRIPHLDIAYVLNDDKKVFKTVWGRRGKYKLLIYRIMVRQPDI